MWKYPHSLNSGVSSCGWKPFFQLRTRLTAPATKKQIQMLQLLCPTGMHSYNHRRRLSSLTRTQRAEPGSQDYSAKSHETSDLSSGTALNPNPTAAAGLHGNLCNKMFPFYAKKILKSLFGTCVDMSNIRGSRIYPSLLCLCIVVCQYRSALWPSGIRGSWWISGPSLILVFCLGTFQEGGCFAFLSDW